MAGHDTLRCTGNATDIQIMRFPMPSHIPSVTIYSRNGCHLCEVIYRMARRIQTDLAFQLRYVDVEAEADLAHRFGEQVPVVLIDGREIFFGRITESQLRRAIEKARWRNPISRILSRLKLALKRGRSFL